MATIGTVNVRITGDISGLVAQLKAAGLQVEGFDKKVRAVGGNVQGVNAQARGFSNLARAFTNAAGTTGVLNSEISILASSVGNVGLAASVASIGVGALALGLGASIASAISFEAAITKVAKTANFSKEETAAFGEEILDLSRKMPVATADLLRIAEVAGQLGIQGTGNIAAFVEEVAKLNSTTGVASDVLATALGTLVQVSGLGIEAIDNISASLTHLGNTSNSTEAQILDFATRLVGIGASLGIPLADILSISSSFAAAGVPVERGGTAIQNILIAIEKAAADGGDELALFADVAGLTVEQFRALEATDPGIAFTKVVEGFASVSNVLPVLEALGIADDRIVASALAAANAQGGLTAPLLENRDAAIQAKATNDEYARSLDTTQAQFQILKNNIAAAATTLGQVFEPAIQTAITAINDFITAIQNGTVDAEVAILGLAAIVGGLVLAFGPLAAVPLLIGAIAIQMGILTNDTAETSDAVLNFENAWFRAEIGILNVIHNVENAILTAIIAPINLAILALNEIGNAGDFFGITVPDIGTIGTESLGETAAQKAKREVERRIIANNNRIGPLSASDEAALIAGEGVGFTGGTTTGTGGRDLSIPPSLGPSGGGGSGARVETWAEKVMKAAADGVVSLGEALELGLSDAQVVALELAVAENAVAEEEFRRRIGLQALAAAYPGLTGEEVKFRLGLEAIAEHLLITGQSIEQFILDTSTTLLEGFQSAFAAIFNKPTKEDSALQLQLLEAQRRKLLLGGGGSESQKKAIDGEIERLQNLIAIRQNADEITKTRAEIADNTAITDAEQAAAAELYIIAIGDASDSVALNAGIVNLQSIAMASLRDQTLGLTTTFGSLNAAASNQLSLADALKALAALPDHGQSLLPAAALGTGPLPYDMTIRAHRGEQIVPAFRSGTGESGQPINITSYITIEGDATDRTVELIKKAVREEAETAVRRASFRGSYVTSGAYTPS